MDGTCEHAFVTSQGSAHGRFQRAIAKKDLFTAAITAKEMGGLSLIDALDYVALMAEVQPDRLDPAAIRWHGRLELESALLTMGEAQLALAALAHLKVDASEALPLLKRLLRHARPTLMRRMG